MAEDKTGSGWIESGMDDSGGRGSDEARVAQLLADLAGDPAAPPSSVTALSVIAAARVVATASSASIADRRADAAESAEPGETARAADVVEFRPRRRRLALAGLVAAASLAGISALVITLTVSGGSSTSTSADGARAASGESVGAFESAAAAAAPPAALPSEPPEAAPQTAGDADAAAGEAQDNSAPAADSGAAGSGQELATGAGCWPALSAPALGALTVVLPPGAFGSPLPLTADCEPGAVGGVILPGTARGTVLVVRVSAAVPGACVSDTSSGTACTARGDDVYVAGDAAGSPVVYAYGNGNQVVVSGWPAAGDSVAVASGLTVEQSVAAAEAVLGAVG